MMNKVCLIGSTRFIDRFNQANAWLTKRGYVVYSVATVTTREHELPEEEKMVLDLVHLQKIVESDVVLIISDESGYYGFSTKREIIWSAMNDKPVLFAGTQDELEGSFPSFAESPSLLKRGIQARYEARIG